MDSREHSQIVEAVNDIVRNGFNELVVTLRRENGTIDVHQWGDKEKTKTLIAAAHQATFNAPVGGG